MKLNTSQIVSGAIAGVLAIALWQLVIKPAIEKSNPSNGS